VVQSEGAPVRAGGQPGGVSPQAWCAFIITEMNDREHRESIPSARYDEEYFLTSCEGYREFIESEGKALSRRLEEAFAVAEVRSGMQVLDIGSGRGEIVRYCAHLGADAYGIDFAAAANRLAGQAIAGETEATGRMGIIQGDAKRLPFCNTLFDRVLMFDIVEHLYPWELNRAFLEAHRVLKDDGRLVIHTAPNRWYDRYAYPLVRLFRTLTGDGGIYPKNPRELIPANVNVHVNEQDILSLPLALRRAGFRSQVWLDSPPQRRKEGALLAAMRVVAFEIPPFRWFFEREVFAVARKL
jgi:SAM-dependent methyltransferase